MPAFIRSRTVATSPRTIGRVLKTVAAGRRRVRTLSCCRRARFSNTRSRREQKNGKDRQDPQFAQHEASFTLRLTKLDRQVNCLIRQKFVVLAAGQGMDSKPPCCFRGAVRDKLTTCFLILAKRQAETVPALAAAARSTSSVVCLMHPSPSLARRRLTLRGAGNAPRLTSSPQI